MVRWAEFLNRILPNKEVSMKAITVGFLGCGGIGCGVWELLEGMREQIAHREGLVIRVKRILVRDAAKSRAAEIPESLLTTCPDEVLSDPEISVILEFMGGEHPALEYLCRALEAGKTVVTANKMAVALGWPLCRSPRLFITSAVAWVGPRSSQKVKVALLPAFEPLGWNWMRLRPLLVSRVTSLNPVRNSKRRSVSSIRSL